MGHFDDFLGGVLPKIPRFPGVGGSSRQAKFSGVLGLLFKNSSITSF